VEGTLYIGPEFARQKLIHEMTLSWWFPVIKNK
jgi:hypothetical protein